MVLILANRNWGPFTLMHGIKMCGFVFLRCNPKNSVNMFVSGSISLVVGRWGRIPRHFRLEIMSLQRLKVCSSQIHVTNFIGILKITRTITGKSANAFGGSGIIVVTGPVSCSGASIAIKTENGNSFIVITNISHSCNSFHECRIVPTCLSTSFSVKMGVPLGISIQTNRFQYFHRISMIFNEIHGFPGFLMGPRARWRSAGEGKSRRGPNYPAMTGF